MKSNKDPKHAALRYLSYRDRTGFEVVKHLREKGFGEDEISDVLKYLAENRFIDDEEYCRRFTDSFVKKGRGPLRIKHELEKKGVSFEMIQATLFERFGEGREFDLALETARRLQNREVMEKARLARRLASSGFHADIIYRVLEQI
jgi:regulatory protein